MKPRILFYSHDSCGLGHFRRSLTIAGYLARRIPDLSVLMMTGLDSAASFEVPPGVDFVKLPGVRKSGPDEYASRHLRVSLSRVKRLREKMILGIVHSFDPSIVVVDNVPGGIDGELRPMLRYLKRRRPHTQIALTLRDIVDHPEQTVPLWLDQDVFATLRRFYDEIWVAGSQSVFDPAKEYGMAKDNYKKLKYCGYIVRSQSNVDLEQIDAEFHLRARPNIVVSCGGGVDGSALIETYVPVAERMARRGFNSMVFLGPDMPTAQRRALKQQLFPLQDFVTVFDYRPDLIGFIELCAVSVSMGGYNTVSEVMSCGKPAVIVPRVFPRLEQLMRARILEQQGLAGVVEPDDLTPDNLETTIVDQIALADSAGRPDAHELLDFGGLRRITQRVQKMLGIENEK